MRHQTTSAGGRQITAVSVAALVALSLAGCAPEAAEETRAPTTTASASPSAAPVELTIDSLLAEKAPGDTLTGEEVAIVRANFDSGHNAYELMEGSHLLLERGRDLPDVVVADIATRMREAVLPAIATGEANSGVVEARAVQDAATASTGKRILLVYPMISYLPPAFEVIGQKWVYSSEALPSVENGATAVDPSYYVRDNVIRRAQERIAGLDNPSQWVIIVMDPTS